jgi:hypothetical protein
MTSVYILRTADGTYAVTVNGVVVAAGLTSTAAWEEAERLVEFDTTEGSRQELRYPRASKSQPPEPMIVVTQRSAACSIASRR